MPAESLYKTYTDAPITYFATLRPFRSFDSDEWVDPVDPLVAGLVSAETSRELGILPFEKVGDRYHVAISGALLPEAQQVMDSLLGSVVLCGVTPADMEFAQDRVFGLPDGMADERLGGILLTQEKLSSLNLVEALRVQHETGARIGSLLSSRNSVNHWDVAQGLARQHHLPLINLLNEPWYEVDANSKPLENVWNTMGESFWFRHLAVPLYINEDNLYVALVDPDDSAVIEELSQATGKDMRVFVTGYRDVISSLNKRYGRAHEEQSRLGLLQTDPENSAHRQLSRGQVVALLVFGLIIAVSIGFRPHMSGVIAIAMFELFYAVTGIYRLLMMFLGTSKRATETVTQIDWAATDLSSLPAYTVLVPLYKEASVLPSLTRAISNLIYPKDRLDVKFLLEEDDLETIEACKNAKLPHYIDLVIVPASEPRTKPKACNYGVMKARGEFLVIFDAEDIPEPDQLLKAVALFRSQPEEVACVQAKLSHYNSEQNLMTRFFTAEYATWYELLLPALAYSNQPIPISGNSSHFRLNALLEMGGWDPFNVTEDADLGVRLFKLGYRTAVIDSITREEANPNFVNWVRQRSRWIKGFIQTWLVHMRRPIKLYKQTGLKGLIGFHAIIGGTPLMLLINPVFWILLFVWYVFKLQELQTFFNGWVFYLSETNFILGNFIFIYASMVGLARYKQYNLVKFVALSPIYWAYMSIAAWKAIYQLFTRPSYWEKTTHGLSTPHTDGISPPEITM